MTGSCSWSGGDTKNNGVPPTEWRPFTYKVDFKDRLDILVSIWLSKGDFDFGIIYFNEPDHSGHQYRPNALEMIPAIKRKDRFLGYFMQRLEEENLTVIVIEDYINSSLLLDVVGGGDIAHLRPPQGKAQKLAQALSGVDHMTVYMKEDILELYHYTHRRRIMPVVVVAGEGNEIYYENSSGHSLRGTHGYSIDAMDMKTISIASGSSFRQGVEEDPIKSVDIYPLLCHLLNLDPAPNNGSLERIKSLLRPGGPGNVSAFNHACYFSVFLMAVFNLIIDVLRLL